MQSYLINYLNLRKLLYQLNKAIKDSASLNQGSISWLDSKSTLKKAFIY